MHPEIILNKYEVPMNKSSFLYYINVTAMPTTNNHNESIYYNQSSEVASATLGSTRAFADKHKYFVDKQSKI